MTLHQHSTGRKEKGDRTWTGDDALNNTGEVITSSTCSALMRWCDLDDRSMLELCATSYEPFCWSDQGRWTHRIM